MQVGYLKKGKVVKSNLDYTSQNTNQEGNVAPKQIITNGLQLMYQIQIKYVFLQIQSEEIHIKYVFLQIQNKDIHIKYVFLQIQSKEMSSFNPYKVFTKFLQILWEKSNCKKTNCKNSKNFQATHLITQKVSRFQQNFCWLSIQRRYKSQLAILSKFLEKTYNNEEQRNKNVQKKIDCTYPSNFLKIQHYCTSQITGVFFFWKGQIRQNYYTRQLHRLSQFSGQLQRTKNTFFWKFILLNFGTENFIRNIQFSRYQIQNAQENYQLTKLMQNYFKYWLNIQFIGHDYKKLKQKYSWFLLTLLSKQKPKKKINPLVQTEQQIVFKFATLLYFLLLLLLRLLLLFKKRNMPLKTKIGDRSNAQILRNIQKSKKQQNILQCIHIYNTQTINAFTRVSKVYIYMHQNIVLYEYKQLETDLMHKFCEIYKKAKNNKIYYNAYIYTIPKLSMHSQEILKYIYTCIKTQFYMNTNNWQIYKSFNFFGKSCDMLVHQPTPSTIT
eukprot:TRINITY_DN17470_c0_g2_i5.p1 TRINITY_DN17470_c0_g2~~TRINITY_DN17470_c0_g2_i5.p1  ORF type:complete len:496 (+),score=-15.35 TRINITY_DN17470_c0_g2_i5:378-1865(+)